MYKFVDLHCHILHNLDDGARSEHMMQKMLDMAYEDGTRVICFTPHFKIYEFDSEMDMYTHTQRTNRRFASVVSYASEKYPDLQLFLGNEIMYHSDIYDSLHSKKCNFLGTSSYVLVEFIPDCSAFEIKNIVSQLLRQGIKPIIAHIERYSAFIKNFSLLYELKESGVLFQVNAGSITKFKFGKIASFLKNAFKKKLVDIVASDAHNDSSLTPQLSKAFEHISKRYNIGYAQKLFCDNPLAIITDKKVF